MLRTHDADPPLRASVMWPSTPATVNVEMGVGVLAETVTVSGAAPLVDVHSSTSSTLMSREVLESIPVASTSPQGFAALTPGITSVALGSIGQCGKVVAQGT